MKKKFNRLLSFALCVLMTFTIVVGASCNKKSFPVIFVPNAGDATVTNMPEQQTVKENSFASKPTVIPNYVGHTFGGWYTTDTCETEFDFSSTAITKRTFIYAKWTANVVKHDVTFDLNYTGAPAPEIVSVVRNTYASAPAVAPHREGYDFIGWFSDKAGDFAFNFSGTAITAARTLYAKWDKLWTVTYHFNYEDSPSAVTETYRESQITVERARPTGREGFYCTGWYTGPTGGELYEFGASLTEDIALYARWIETTPDLNYFTVTLDLNYPDSTPIVIEQVLEGTTASRPTNPSRPELGFAGWFYEIEGITPFTFSTPITSDLTLYAKWISQVSFFVDLNYEGAPEFNAGTTYNRTYSPGATVPAAPASVLAPPKPVDPITECEYDDEYELAGWSFASKEDPSAEDPFLAAFFGTATFSESVTVFAQWRYKYTFEAELTNLMHLTGSSVSGAPKNRDNIIPVKNGEGFWSANAGNDLGVSFLYGDGCEVRWEITSDRATTATLWFRMAAEFTWQIFYDGDFMISVNGESLNYESILNEDGEFILDIPRDYWDKAFSECQDYFGFTVQLSEGVNDIRYRTTNSRPTEDLRFSGTAPVLDSIKLKTVAKLTWEPAYWNLGIIERFMEKVAGYEQPYYAGEGDEQP